MKYLDRLRAGPDHKKVFGGGLAPTEPTKPPHEGGTLLPEPTKPSSVSSAGAEPPAETFSVEALLPPIQEAARRDVLARLETHPTVKRAFTTRTEGDVLIVTLAIRDVGTAELAIPAGRFNRNSLADWDALLRSLELPT